MADQTQETFMHRDDSQWLDRMYNNRALVPEHAAHFERWSSESETVRRRVESRLDIAYGDGSGETLDIFPGAAASAPVLVFIHGGYWRSLDKSDHSFLAPSFTEKGVCVVVPNYALCPAVTIPQITLQMVKALAWTYRNITRHGGDPARITVVGHSAGGHLAAMLLTCAWKAYAPDLPVSLLKNALGISSVYDLAPLRLTPFLKDSLRLTPAQVRKASPALLPRPKLSQGRGTLCTVAGGDESPEFLRQNQLIRDVWGPKAVPVCEALPGLNHFSVLETLIEPGHRLNTLAWELLLNK
jgi:arylformamidase